MISKEECLDLIDRLNEEAHDTVWDLWTEAQAAEENDEDPYYVEELQELASLEQRYEFQFLVDALSPEEKEAIAYYKREDKDFREQFFTYNGEE